MASSTRSHHVAQWLQEKICRPPGSKWGTFCFGVGVRATAVCFTKFRAAAASLDDGVIDADAASLDDGGVFSAAAASNEGSGGSNSRKDSIVQAGGNSSSTPNSSQPGSSSSKSSEACSPDSNAKAKSTTTATRWPKHYFLPPLQHVVRT